MQATAAISFDRWQAMLQALGGDGRAAGRHYRTLLRSYSAPERAYHGTTHLERCLGLLDAAPATTPGERPAVEAALWFHDAVYEPGAPDNEFCSAQWAWQALMQAGVARHRCRHVARLVMATRHHLADDADTALVVDVDLAILGAHPADYADYEANVREEYASTPDELYRSVRAGILTAILQRHSIFRTPYFRARFEANARRNLRRAIARLEA